jgi:peptidylprolyl isomerase
MNAEADGNDTLVRAFTQLRSRPDNGTHVPMTPAVSVPRLAALPIAAALVILALACGGEEEQGFIASTETAVLTPVATNPPTPNCPPPSPTGTPPEVQMKSYPARPELSIDVSHKFIAHVYTTRGHFIVELLPDIAPEHVNSFVFLARDKFYNGTVFHRVVPAFVAQGGDPTGTGTGGPGYTVPLEPSEEPFVRSAVGMARSNDPNSAGSQWFVTLGDSPHLNGQYTVFGRVVQGMEIVDCIQIGDAIITLDIQEL